MSMNESQFLDNLANDLKPNRFWSPVTRSMLFIVFLFVSNLAVLLYEQGFRPGFVGELSSHPRFLLELLTSFSIIICCIYFTFISFVPGFKSSPWMKYLAYASVALFGLCLYLSFQSAAPESTFAGARHNCRDEVFLYSFIGLFVFSFFAFRSAYPTHKWGYLFMGISSAMVSGTIMQIACMYSPMHALDHHYGPALLVATIVGITLPWIKSRSH